MSRQTAGILFIGLSLLAATTLLHGDEKAKNVPTANKDTNKTHVELTIDYGDGAQKRFPKVPIASNATVLEVLVWASKHPHGIKLKHRGQGALALVSQIDDLKNRGAKGNNWIFSVDGKLGTRSCGAEKVEPGAKIQWKFDEYK